MDGSSVASIMSFLFRILQYGGAIVAALGAITFVLARKNANDELASSSGWIVLAGIVAAAVGTFLADHLQNWAI